VRSGCDRAGDVAATGLVLRWGACPMGSPVAGGLRR